MTALIIILWAATMFMMGAIAGMLYAMLVNPRPPKTEAITFLFTGNFQHGPEFMDTVDSEGFGVGVGSWDFKRPDGYYGLVVDVVKGEVRR